MRRAQGLSRCPPRHSPRRPCRGPRGGQSPSSLLRICILWFACVVEVEPRPEGVAAPPPFFAVGICLLLVLIFALGALVIGDLLFAGFFAGVLSLLIVPDKLPQGLDLLLVVPLLILGVLDASRPQGRRYALQPAAQHLRSPWPRPRPLGAVVHIEAQHLQQLCGRTDPVVLSTITSTIPEELLNRVGDGLVGE